MAAPDTPLLSPQSPVAPAAPLKPSYRQPASGPLVLIEQAFKQAIETHPAVIARRSDRDAANSSLDGAKWGRFPTVTVQNGLDQLGDRVTTARVEQPLWTGGLITGRIEAGSAAVKKSEAALLEAEQEMLNRVTAAYSELGRMSARIVIAESNVQEHERLFAMIQRRVENEVSPESDSVLAQARLSQARVELGQLDGLANRARSTLEQAIGGSVGRVAKPASPKLAVASLDHALTAALDFSPALARLASDVQASEAEITVTRGSAMPRVIARYDQSWGGQDTTRREDRVILALEYQSGAGLSSASNIRAAASRRDSARSAQDAARRDVIDAVTGDWADLQSINAQLPDLRAQVESTAGIFDSYVRQYAVGRKSWIDVLNAQREASQARYALSDAEWASLRAVFRLQIATGEIRATSLSAASGALSQKTQ